jgi:hypothetical protein
MGAVSDIYRTTHITPPSKDSISELVIETIRDEKYVQFVEVIYVLYSDSLTKTLPYNPPVDSVYPPIGVDAKAVE